MGVQFTTSHLQSAFTIFKLKMLSSFSDFVTGGECSNDPITDLPNGNCVFQPSPGENSFAMTSLLATPFLEEVCTRFRNLDGEI